METNSPCKRFNATLVCLLRGDITRQTVDAIVNAANSGLRGGGGVDGAIQRAGGPSILEECKLIRSMQGDCHPGSAVITGAGKLSAKWVIHAVGPIWRGGQSSESKTLGSAYRTSLQLAVDNDVTTIAFPSISTGAYGYPIEEAANIAVTTVSEFCGDNESLQEIRFVLFDEFTFAAFKKALGQLPETSAT